MTLACQTDDDGHRIVMTVVQVVQHIKVILDKNVHEPLNGMKRVVLFNLSPILPFCD